MYQKLLIILMLLLPLLGGCMKRRRVANFSAQNQSLLTSPNDTSAICPSGAQFRIRPLSGSNIFETGKPVLFVIEALGTPCLHGYQILSGQTHNGQSFSQRTDAWQTYQMVNPLQREVFRIGIRDASLQVIQSFDYESDYFEVSLASPPTCQVNPGTLYLPRSSVGSNGSVQSVVDITLSKSGALESISTQDTALSLSTRTSLPQSFLANQRKTISFSTARANGTLQFNIKSSENVSGSCLLPVVERDCNRDIEGVFIEEDSSEWFGSPTIPNNQFLKISCETKDIWATVNGDRYLMGRVAGELPLQVLSGNLDQDAPTELLFVRKDSNGNGQFTLLNKKTVETDETTSQEFAQISCTQPNSGWPASQLPAEFRLDLSATPPKIKGVVQGTSYEASVTAGENTCVISAPTESPASVSLRLSSASDEVDYKVPFNLIWSAENIRGYACSLNKMTGTEITEVLEQNLNGDSIVERSFTVSNGIENSTDYEVKCESSESGTLRMRITAKIREGSGPFIKVYKSGLHNTPITSFDPFNHAEVFNATQEQGFQADLKWGFPNAPCSGTCCTFAMSPRGPYESESVTGRINWRIRTLEATTVFSLTCDGASPVTTTVRRLGSPRIKPGTQAAVSFANQDPHTTRSQNLIVESHSGGAKIKILGVKIVNDAFQVVHSAHLRASGCGGDLDAGARCTVAVNYVSGTHNHAVSGKLGVEYQAYGPSGNLGSVRKAIVANVAGRTRNRICDRKGRNCR